MKYLMIRIMDDEEDDGMKKRMKEEVLWKNATNVNVLDSHA